MQIEAYIEDNEGKVFRATEYEAGGYLNKSLNFKQALAYLDKYFDHKTGENKNPSFTGFLVFRDYMNKAKVVRTPDYLISQVREYFKLKIFEETKVVHYSGRSFDQLQSLLRVTERVSHLYDSVRDIRRDRIIFVLDKLIELQIKDYNSDTIMNKIDEEVENYIDRHHPELKEALDSLQEGGAPLTSETIVSLAA
jgi:hypothetical protein